MVSVVHTNILGGNREEYQPVSQQNPYCSPVAFASTLAKHEDSLRTARKRQHQAPAALSLSGVLRRQAESVDEEFGDDDAYADSTDEAIASATALFQQVTDDEAAMLAELRTWAASSVARPDSKATELIRWLGQHIRSGDTWSDERVIIFTEYRDTQKWLVNLLAAHGFGGNRLLTLYGGMVTEERERIKAAFQAGPKDSDVRILVATDAASEGIDLQNHCAKLIHYEIPWNPNRLEQRNGRIDRHGQHAKEVLIYHFVGRGYAAQSAQAVRQPGNLEGDLEFLLRAARKVEAIREDLGKVGPVIAEQVEQAMMGRRLMLDTDAAELDAGAVRAMLRVERQLRDRIARLHDQLQTSKQDLHMTPERVEQVVTIGLALAGQPALVPTDRPLDEHGRPIRAFQMPALRAEWAPCSEGLRHPHTGKIRPIVFDHSLAEGRDDVVLVHVGHRLVQMCLRLLRSEIWSSAGTAKLRRVTARPVPDDVLDTPAVFAHARLVALGGDGQRLHEELLAAGGRLREGRFARLNVGEVRTALAASLDEPLSPAWQERLATAWPGHADSLQSALLARQSERMAGLARFLHDRQTKEARDAEAVLTELRRSILAALDQPEMAQLALFATAEQEQLQRNADALRARAAEIPAEIERERRAIAARYAEPTAHLFPVAVTYLVPVSMARRGVR